MTKDSQEKETIPILTEKAAISPLSEGKSVLIRGIGNSMTPLLKSGEIVRLQPIDDETTLKKGDIVLAKVNGRVYLHKITGVKIDSYQISNNHGHVNGWASRKQVYGKLDRTDTNPK